MPVDGRAFRAVASRRAQPPDVRQSGSPGSVAPSQSQSELDVSRAVLDLTLSGAPLVSLRPGTLSERPCDVVVIAAETGADGGRFEGLVSQVNSRLPAGKLQPGVRGFFSYFNRLGPRSE